MTALSQYDRARAALAEATRIDQVVPLLDEIEHIKLHAKQIRDRGLLADATEFQLRAERRLGEVLGAAKEAGHFAEGRPKKNGSDAEPFPPATLAEVGVDKKLSSRAQKAAALPTQAFEATITVTRERIAAGAATIIDKEAAQAEKRGRREDRELALGIKQQALPDEKFGVIYADPEWRFEPYSRASGLDRAADNHYPTSDIADIAARDVAAIAADDCVLFLWATAPMLEQALHVLRAWGFAYKSHFIWAKDRIGTGYWSRNKHELLLVGTRRDIPAPAMGTQWNSLIDAPVGAHSAKPEKFLELIEAYFPTLPKIELNRRGPARPGWAAWGNEAEHTAA